MPNSFAYLMLGLWPIVTLAMFRFWPKERAFVWSLLGAYLFLPPPPAAFDLPMMPPLTKESLPSLVTFLVVWARFGRPALLPSTMAGRVLAAIFVLSPIATVLTNPEPVVFGRIWIQPLGLKDMVALVLLQFILLLPLLMARRVLASAEGQREVLLGLFVGGLIYSLPMLLEVRLSPQLNIWIYGYFQHSFEQMMRDGGFRPIVFLYHGLWVAFFCMTAVCAGLALSRSGVGQRKRVLYLAGAAYLLAVLVLCKSLGSLLLGAVAMTMILLLPRRTQLRAAALIALVAISYPVLKGADLIPVEWMLSEAAQVDPDRAASLRFRFDNEDTLMERAMEKPLFGWGSWGRNHIMHPVTGEILTVTDGRWIILIGVFGWAGYLAEFGLLALPILMLWRDAGRAPRGSFTPYLGPMAVLLAINIVDMLPNATLTPLTWMLAGALLGYAEHLRGLRVPNRQPLLLRWRSVM